MTQHRLAFFLKQTTSANGPPSATFDLSVPQAERERLARNFVIENGKVNGMTPFGPINYTFNADGTFYSAWCIPYGEVSERKFTKNGEGKWEVHEARYRDTGKIFYAVHLEDDRTGLLVDRDNGLVMYNGGDPPSPTPPGHTTNCGK